MDILNQYDTNRRVFLALNSLWAFNFITHSSFAQQDEKEALDIDELSDDFNELWKTYKKRLIDWKIQTVTRNQDKKTIETLYFGMGESGNLFFSLAQIPENSLEVEVYPKPFKTSFGELGTFDVIKKTEKRKPYICFKFTNSKDNTKFFNDITRGFNAHFPVTPSIRSTSFLKKQIAEMQEWEKTQKPKSNYSEVSLSCAIGDIDTLQKLISSKADLNQPDGQGLTPILVALLPKDSENLRKIVEEEIKTNEKKELAPEEFENEVKKKIALHGKNRKLIIKNLMDAQKRSNLMCQTPKEGGVFHIALQLMINKEDEEGSIFLYLLKKREAIEKNSPDCVGALALQDENGNTPYHIAGLYGLNDILKKILEERSGLGFHLANSNGQVLLDILIQSNNLEMVKFWVDNFYPVEKVIFSDPQELPSQRVENPKYKSVLMQACEMNFNNPQEEKTNEEIVKKLLLGAFIPRGLPDIYDNVQALYVDVQDENGDSALHFAVKSGRTKIVRYLLTGIKKSFVPWTLATPIQANPNIQNNEGKTPFHLAVELGKIDIVKQLLENERIEPNVLTELNPNITPSVLLNPVKRIRSQINSDFYKSFFDKETQPPYLPDKKGESALYYAVILAAGGKPEILEILMSSPKITTDVCKDEMSAQQVVEKWEKEKTYSSETCQKIFDILKTKVEFNFPIVEEPYPEDTETYERIKRMVEEIRSKTLRSDSSKPTIDPMVP